MPHGSFALAHEPLLREYPLTMGITLWAERHGADGIRKCDTVQHILGDARLFLIIHPSKCSYTMFFHNTAYLNLTVRAVMTLCSPHHHRGRRGSKKI
jgi:hypothetical protein